MLPLLLTALLLAESIKDVDAALKQEETAHKEDLFTRALHYMESNPETLDELLTKNYTVVEGDIILSRTSRLTKYRNTSVVIPDVHSEPEVSLLSPQSDRNAVGWTWPTKEIPYVISPEIASKTGDILSAMAMLSEHSCVSFHHQTSETNYLHFENSIGCASYVGFIGGKQPVFVGPSCIVGNIMHEILHALGFHHEHTRTDREQHITILYHNIMAGMERNFKEEPGQTFNLPYDITSIMHYGSDFFSANGLPTIVPKKYVKDMGQRVRLTEMDIKRVGRFYSCDTKEEPGEKSSSEEGEDANAHVRPSNVASASRSLYQSHFSANKPKKETRLLLSDCST